MTDKPTGQLAYEAYRDHLGTCVNHKNKWWPTWQALPELFQSAWQSFAEAATAGVPVSRAYSENYLGGVFGQETTGSPAQPWAYIVACCADIAAAWQKAWMAVHR